jgi:imidazole glycerol-phosphate synthase subunit HisH
MIAVLNTGVANAASVLYAFERMGYTAVLTQDPDEISKSSRLILPGVGTAGALMGRIQSLEIKESLLKFKEPVLGICLGMQAMYEFSDESKVSCLGVFKGKIKKLKVPPGFSSPHMGWNQVSASGECQLLNGIQSSTYFYFVHSFRAPQGPETRAVTEYGEQIPSVVESSNWFGTQFHPERSGAAGEALLRNFLKL